MDRTTLAKKWRDTFSKVYCVTYAPYIERRKPLVEELVRVGILHEGYNNGEADPFFKMHYTVPNPIEEKLLDHPGFKWPKNNMRFNKGALSLALGHYAVMKEAIYLGHLRILIIEDDVAFLKDLSKIYDILDNMPLSADLVMFDKVTNWKEGWDHCLEARKVNDYYVKLAPDNILWTTSCYSVTPEAMWHICDSQEKAFNVADYYTNDFVPTEDYKILVADQGIQRFSSISNLACQRPSEETISDHGTTNSVYNQRGLFDCYINLEEYNI